MGQYLRPFDLDWSALGFDEDPVPGDCEALCRASQQCGARADLCGQVAALCNETACERASFSGKAAASLQHELGNAGKVADTLAFAFRSAQSVLVRWDADLEEIQRSADTLCQQAMQRQKDYTTCQVNIDSVQSELQQIVVLGSDADQGREDQLRLEYSNYSNELQDIQDDLSTLIGQVLDLVEEYEAQSGYLAGELVACEDEMRRLHDWAAEAQTIVDAKDSVEAYPGFVGAGLMAGLVTYSHYHPGTTISDAFNSGCQLVANGKVILQGARTGAFLGAAKNLVAGSAASLSGAVKGAFGGAKNAISDIKAGFKADVENIQKPFVIEGLGKASFDDAVKAAGQAAKAKGTVVGSVIGGLLDATMTYTGRVGRYGTQAATQDAVAHGVISTAAGIGGAAVGASVGSVVGSIFCPGLGTAAGAAVGALLGSGISKLGNGIYDRIVGRSD